ncbi:2-phospho-L-lactate guanylyltransferase [Natronomonas salina]|uniref:2-phospho-L-lactate guanylyltransferase n=1 Tax=Natronomonas salina TaxID=1710540 RepID=UPI0015B44E60|nr:2-phospho-L-lactate guanylyltransferase [Natronomonas salina]QLD90466.1 2-phospho-L-lactate guanylyltransferase [Natronomonas salina]
MDVLVPFAADEPKTRLADVLEPDERTAFARELLLDVCDAIRAADGDPTVLSTAPIDCPHPVVVDDRPLTAAVNAHLEAPMAVVMADLALATPAALRRLFETDAEVTLAPGLGGGTNAFVTRHPEFAVDYHGASIRDHRRIAREVGADVETVDSFRLAVDVDEPEDLAEVLLHGGGRALSWLETAGFAVESTDGRVIAGR